MNKILIDKESVNKIIDKEIENTSSYLEHDTQINIKFALEDLPSYNLGEIIDYIDEQISYYEDEKLKCLQNNKIMGACYALSLIDVVKDIREVVLNGGTSDDT